MSSPTRRISKELEREIRDMQAFLSGRKGRNVSFVEASSELAALNRRTKLRIVL